MSSWKYSLVYVHGGGLQTGIRLTQAEDIKEIFDVMLLLQLAQISQAQSYGNLSGACPSMVIISRSFNVLLLNNCIGRS